MKPFITFSKLRSRVLDQHIMPMTLSSFIYTLHQKYSPAKEITSLETAFILREIVKNDLRFYDFLDDKEYIFEEMASFFISCKRNEVAISEFGFEKEKERDLNIIFKAYNDFLKKKNLADLGDIERFAYKYTKDNAFEIRSDSFWHNDIHFFESRLQQKIYNNFQIKERIEEIISTNVAATTYIEAFDAFDEVQKMLKAIRKLIDDGVAEKDIKVFASDVDAYYQIINTLAPEYGLSFHSTLGEPIIKFDQRSEYVQQEAQRLAKRLQKIVGKDYSSTIQEKLSQSLRLYNSQGIEVTETNQIYLYKDIDHLFFLGADLEQFPPSRHKGVFYTKKSDELFFRNSLYKTSVDIYERMQKVAKNLTIIYQKSEHSGKDISPIIQKRDPKSIEYAWHANDEAVDVPSEPLHFHPHRLSASQINTYLNCPRAYYYKYVLKIESPAFEDTEMDVMLKGRIMHKVFELIVKDLMEKQADIEDIDIQIYIQRALDDNEIKKDLQEDIYEQIFLKELQEEIAKNFLTYLQRENIKSAFTEQKICLDENLRPVEKDDCDGFIVGYIDRIDINEHITIVDYKSSKRDTIDKDKLKDIKEFKDVQLPLYILWAKQKYQKDVEASLLTFRTGDPELPYVAFAAMKTCKKPSKEYVCFDDTFENNLKTIIKSVQASMANSFFEVSPEAKCDYCAYVKICDKES